MMGIIDTSGFLDPSAFLTSSFVDTKSSLLTLEATVGKISPEGPLYSCLEILHEHFKDLSFSLT